MGNTETTGYESTVGLTRTWSATLVSEFRLGFFRNNSEIVPPSAGINDAATLGIGTQYGIAAPELTISGYTLLGSNTNTQRTQIDNNYQTIASTTKSLGNHLIQFGGQFRRNQFDDLKPTGDVNGSYTFDGSITSAKNSSGDPINSLADFLPGEVKTSTYSLAQPLIGRRNFTFGLYILPQCVSGDSGRARARQQPAGACGASTRGHRLCALPWPGGASCGARAIG